MLLATFNSIATAQQAHLVEISAGSGIGTAILPNGRIIVFTWTENKPVPINKIDKATYVYEKDDGPIPVKVASALNKLNAEGKIVATDFDKDTTTGSGSVPAQYKKSLEAATKVGLPALVVQAGETVIRVIKNPKTEAEVFEAVK